MAKPQQSLPAAWLPCEMAQGRLHQATRLLWHGRSSPPMAGCSGTMGQGEAVAPRDAAPVQGGKFPPASPPSVPALCHVGVKAPWGLCVCPSPRLTPSPSLPWHRRPPGAPADPSGMLQPLPGVPPGCRLPPAPPDPPSPGNGGRERAESFVFQHLLIAGRHGLAHAPSPVWVPSQFPGTQRVQQAAPRRHSPREPPTPPHPSTASRSRGDPAMCQGWDGQWWTGPWWHPAPPPVAGKG